MERHARRGLKFALLTTLIASALVLGLAEVAVRLLGFAPWTPLMVSPGAPLMTEADPDLGWRNLPGHYRYKTRPDLPEAIEVTIDPDGGRHTRSGSEQRPIWFFGGSFTFGWAVDDRAAFAQVFARDVSDRLVRNYSVAGYGTVQSLMSYRQRTRDGGGRPDDVVYGFIERHIERNVASRQWLGTLTRAAWPRGPIRLPHVGPGGTIETPKGYDLWPLARVSALVNLGLSAYDRQADRHVLDDAATRSVDLLRHWDEQVREARGRFRILLLYTETDRAAYLQRFEQAGLDVIDCPPTAYPALDAQVPGDHHPNAEIHRLWAQCLTRAFAVEGS